jgi:predicted nucleic acid-binding protein
MAWSTGRAGHIWMILVDTNVLSAMMRVTVEPAVERWFDGQPPESIWTTTITSFEIHFGLALLAPGRRRDRLYDAFDRAIGEILGGRVLPFDRTAAETAAAIAPGSGKSAGRSRFATSRSPVSSPRAKQPSPPATPVISKTSASFSSILGTLLTRNGDLASGLGSVTRRHR